MTPDRNAASGTEPRCHRCSGRLPLEGEPYDQRAADDDLADVFKFRRARTAVATEREPQHVVVRRAS